ncbi:hypothetical protein LY78DRAFT_664789 [Colletotrichum sublineola]|nr:hypothetical protein LY78DRAFT_664789 [Colletotrichum sublineola]
MVKISIVLSAIAVALSGVAEARECTKGLRYCGYNLLKIGDYQSDIRKALVKAKQPRTKVTIEQSRFACGDKGAITWVDFCRAGCVDMGSGQHDIC